MVLAGGSLLNHFKPTPMILQRIRAGATSYDFPEERALDELDFKRRLDRDPPAISSLIGGQGPDNPPIF
jgi:hypothetical protein